MKVTAEIPALTGEQIAELFWELDSDQQAKFFNQLGVCVMATPIWFSKETGSLYPLDMQMYEVSKSDFLLRDLGARVMETIGEIGKNYQPRPIMYENSNTVRNIRR